MTKAVIIYGGNTRKSRLKGLLDRAEKFLSANHFEFETIYVHELPAEDLISANFNSESIIEANAKVAAADVIIIVTPTYKASYSGILKTYLDLLPQKGFEGKTVLPLVLGGSFGHLLVIEYALKPVLSALGARLILKGAFVLDTQVEYAESGQFLIHLQAEERLGQVLQVLQEEESRCLPSIHK
ncbi:NADPH-dependent FMN reductase [Pseudobacillus wudalianchiensis]|uniref:FMN reductase (NADPH) n=1 Tax=Pseudobacillus wudalianchiensis TaxID=1743143 RepID=A0A1B9B7G8_9BACI|nr:NADPH-dependent FMN reductase [Bacillus wudalianchiensis]OCA92013.1 FMN reductase (NADPH) [Bacillus wudalianchiensis]